jgi:hypothetical protein
MSDADKPSRSVSRRARRGSHVTRLPETGLHATGRRRQRKRAPLTRWAVSIIGVLVVFAAGGFALATLAPVARHAKAQSPLALPGASGSTTGTVASEEAAAVAPQPTPYFASFRGVRLRLPVPASAVTVVAFHQSSYNDAFAMVSLVRIGSGDRLAATVKAQRGRSSASVTTPASTLSATPPAANSHGVWTGSVLQLWRGSGTRMNTAVDCGAKPGTAVYPPVDGTIMQIRPYRLYGKYADFEIHIKPDSIPGVDVIMLHVTNPCVALGEHVIGGVTPLARVRRLKGLVPGLQLATYTSEGGDHTHFQINVIPQPGRPWVLGSDPPGMVRHGVNN